MLCLLDESEIRATEPLSMLEDSSAFLNQSNLEDMIRTHDSVALSEASLPDQQSLQAQYRNYDEGTGKARNTLYHLVAESKSLYLLSFREGAFVGHQLSSFIPTRATSAQTSNGNIYVLGGVASETEPMPSLQA